MATIDRRKNVPPGTTRVPPTNAPPTTPPPKAPRNLPPPTTPGTNAEVEGMRRDGPRDRRSADDPNGERSRDRGSRDRLGPARRQEEGWKAGQPAPSTVARREERAAAKAAPAPAPTPGGRRGSLFGGGAPGGGIMGFAQRMGWNPDANDDDGSSNGLGGVGGMMALAENINGGHLGVPGDPAATGTAPVTPEGIQAQIDALTAQLATLTGGAPAAAPPVAPLPPTDPRTLTARKPRYGGY